MRALFYISGLRRQNPYQVRLLTEYQVGILIVANGRQGAYYEANEIKEASLETQSGFMLVLKGDGQRLTFSVRRRVGTPPNSQVSMTPDEVRQFSAMCSNTLPQSRNERISVGQERVYSAQPQDNISVLGDTPAAGDFDLFMEKEYPELAAKKRKTGSARLGRTLPFSMPDKKILITGGVLVGFCFLGILGFGVGALLKKPASQKTETQEAARTAAVTVVQTEANVDTMASDYVKMLLDFKRSTYKGSQIKAMAMMTSELRDKYWEETGFPLPREKRRQLPEDQDVRITSVETITTSATTYQADVKGAVVTLDSQGSKSLPVYLKLTLEKDANGKVLVSKQEDLSHTLTAEETSAESSTTHSTSGAGAASPTPEPGQ